LYIALDQGYITQAQFDEIYETAAEAKRLIGSFIRYLQKSQVSSPESAVNERPKTED